MPRSVELFKRMYLRTPSGRVALFSLFLLLCIPLAHFFGGAPPISELRIVEGRVAEVQAREGLKGSTDVELTVSGSNGMVEQLRYYANRGDGTLSELTALKGRAVRAWVKTTNESRIYQIESGNQRIVDYEGRNRQLSGDPQILLIYFFAVLGVFVLLSIKRYSKEA